MLRRPDPLSVLVLVLLALLPLPGAASAFPPATTPLPTVTALAAAQKISLDGIASPRAVSRLRPGDRLSALFTLTDAGRVQQWLADVEIVPLTDEERRAKPPETVIYSGAGGEFHLDSPPAAFALRMFGPVTAAPPPTSGWPEKHARFTLRENFLSFGFDRMGDVVLRLRAVNDEIRVGFMTGAFAADQLAWGKDWARRVGFTREDELVCAKQAFATYEFLQLALHTPGFKEIFEATIKKPSIWTAVRKRNFGCFFNYDWARVTRLDGAAFGVTDQVYQLPFQLLLFGTHVADGVWTVTAARPPLLACAGILGLTIVPPDRLNKRLELRVLAAQPSPETGIAANAK